MWNMPQNTSVRATNNTSQTLNLEIKNQKFNFVDILRKWKRNGENILSKLSTSMKSKLDSEIGTVQKKLKIFSSLQPLNSQQDDTYNLNLHMYYSTH